MTNAEKKRYLQQYQRLNNRINFLMEERERWRGLATRITPSYQPSFGSNGSISNRVQNAVDKVTELDADINAEIDRLVDLRREINRAVHAIQEPKLQELLELRYIKGLSWEAVAEHMHYDLSWVTRLHGRALSKLALKST